MPRPSAGPRRQVHIRLPEELFAELVILRPELQDPNGSVKYGAFNQYFVSLVRRDLDERTRSIKQQLGVATHAP